MNIELFLQLEPLIGNGMTVFQMDKFVINDSITPYRKLRQAFIETKNRLENIVNIELDLEEADLKKLKAEQEASSLEGIDKKLKEIEVRRAVLEVSRKTAYLNQIRREAEFFYNVLKQIIETDLGGIESAKEKLADPDYNYQQEADFWTEKLARGVYADFINYGTISKGLIESIATLPEAQQKLIASRAIDQQIELKDLLDDVRDIALIERD